MQLSFAKSAPLWRDIAVTLAVFGDERLRKSDRSSRWTLELRFNTVVRVLSAMSPYVGLKRDALL